MANSSKVIVRLAVRNWRNAGRTLVWCRGNTGPAWGLRQSLYLYLLLPRTSKQHLLNPDVRGPTEWGLLLPFRLVLFSSLSHVLPCLLCINTSYVLKCEIIKKICNVLVWGLYGCGIYNDVSTVWHLKNKSYSWFRTKTSLPSPLPMSHHATSKRHKIECWKHKQSTCTLC